MCKQRKWEGRGSINQKTFYNVITKVNGHWFVKYDCLFAGVRGELPDPARGSGAAHPAAGQAALARPPPPPLAPRPLRQPVGGGLRKCRQPPSWIVAMTE